MPQNDRAPAIAGIRGRRDEDWRRRIGGVGVRRAGRAFAGIGRIVLALRSLHRLRVGAAEPANILVERRLMELSAAIVQQHRDGLKVE